MLKYIKALRLYSLPLSLTGGIFAAITALAQGYTIDGWVVLLVLLTTAFMQSLSNIANDIGDTHSGVDNLQRTGPIRPLQSGEITPANYKRMFWVLLILSVVSASMLVYVAFETLMETSSLVMLTLGVVAIIAAIKYTLGKGAYGYSGKGDIAVLLFFGFLSVMGTWFVLTQNVNYSLLLPSLSIGALAVGVLNLNNMRDVENDKAHNKQTLVVKMGLEKAKTYHAILVYGAFVFIALYALFFHRGAFAALLLLPLFVMHLRKVNTSEGSQLNPQLGVLALATLAFAIVSSLGAYLYSLYIC